MSQGIKGESENGSPLARSPATVVGGACEIGGRMRSGWVSGNCGICAGPEAKEEPRGDMGKGGLNWWIGGLLLAQRLLNNEAPGGRRLDKVSITGTHAIKVIMRTAVIPHAHPNLFRPMMHQS